MARLRGQVVYLYAFDLGYGMSRQTVPTLLGLKPEPFVPAASKPGPRNFLFYKSYGVNLPAIEKQITGGTIRLVRSVKFLELGALTIRVRVDFEVESLADLVPFHDLQFSDGTFLYDEVIRLAEQALKELRPYIERPVLKLAEEEAYTVFCIETPIEGVPQATFSAEEWIEENHLLVASLLTEERQPQRISRSEATESIGRTFSYYEQDVVTMDWDAALIVDEARYFDEILYIMELANVQLAELEAFDRLLDNSLERSYRDIGRQKLSWMVQSRYQRELRELRIDMARLSDEIQNITKFFGDWHLARIYQGLATRFHLSEWHRAIDEKLKTLDEMYQLLQGERNNRVMVVLEVTIVILFIIDLVLLVTGHIS